MGLIVVVVVVVVVERPTTTGLGYCQSTTNIIAAAAAADAVAKRCERVRARACITPYHTCTDRIYYTLSPTKRASARA